MRVVISNFSRPIPERREFRKLWRQTELPPRPGSRASLFETPVGWGFHLYSLGTYLLDLGVAEQVEFWDYKPERRMSYLPNGILRVMFLNEDDVAAYIDKFGPPDLFVNHGIQGVPVLRLLEHRTFRVHVPTLRQDGRPPLDNAECFLVDSEDQVEERAMIYVPVVNTVRIRPDENARKERDFIYLASCYAGKRHDLILDAVRGTDLTGHLHPVTPTQVDVSGTCVTTSAFDERDVLSLLQRSRIAVYPADYTSNPAAMWECVAAGLPIVVNRDILGGKHLVVPGVTGELAAEEEFLETMRSVLANLDRYRPREYFEATWDTVQVIEGYLEFFRKMGWTS
jgi:hypothetical protein